MTSSGKDWCQGFCRLCGTACADYCEEIHTLRGEAALLKQALLAIVKKGPASPGDRKHIMAADALAELKAAGGG